MGYIILQNFLSAGFDGAIYPVNKEAGEILGLKAYASVGEIRGEVDLAVIAVPAQFVPEALEECGKKKVKTAIVVSGGFAEIGNVDLQNQMATVAEKYDMPTLGPNCLGVMDTRSRVNTLFLPSYKLSKSQIGGVSFISQSGAVGSSVLDVIAGEGFGLSKFISYGNAVNVDEVDILNYLMNDKETEVVIMYLEGVKEGKKFMEIAKKITKIKPVIVLKAGKTQAGANAARSHTASLSGSYAAYEAVFRQCGFTIANDLSDLTYFAKVLMVGKKVSGNRVGVITNGGGTGVLTADAIGGSQYLTLATLSDPTKEALKKTMPVLVNITNPLDLAGDADDKRYGDAISAIGSDANIDMIIAIVLFQTPGADSRVAAGLIRMRNMLDKPMIVLSVGTSYTQMHVMMMESSGLPVFDSPTAAVKSLEALIRYSQYKNRKD